MTETLLTIEQAAERLQLHPESVRRQLRTGHLRGVKRSGQWRVPEGAITEPSPSLAPNRPVNFRSIGGRSTVHNNKVEAVTHAERIADAIAYDRPEAKAARILEGLKSTDAQTRNEAIMALAGADRKTSRLVEAECAKSVAAYTGPDDDFADLRALDGEPFHEEEEAEVKA